MSGIKTSIEERIEYNNYKLIADKIRKTLTNIRNVPGISSKRWIWELIQNSKDVKNKFGKVKIKIELNKNSLKFSHNGSYFSIDDVLGILQQVSSKDSKNLEDQTGKFGTGFIGTHLLSDKISISGYVKYQDIYKKFKINLDRSANSSEELLKEVRNSIENFKRNMSEENSEYKTYSSYNQREEDFDTIFEYELEKENISIATEGLEDLANTAPITLATQFKKISSILIINNIKGEETNYSVNCSKKANRIYLNTIIINEKMGNKTNEKKIFFYSYESESGDSRLLYQVEIKENIKVRERGKNQPILLRDFPLIGSEKFHFPFFLDGFKFNPLETRNGLYLNGNMNQEAIENRRIIENAIKSSISFTKWLVTQSIDKRYLLANTKIPEPPHKYDKFTINWFIEQQKKWRKELIELQLLRDEESCHNQLKNLKIPVFKKEFNEKFLNLFKIMNITGGIIPNEQEIKSWYDIMEKDPLKEVYEIEENTWGFKYLFTEEDLFQKINDYGSIEKFAEDKHMDYESIFKWLNDLYKFLKENKFNDCFFKYNMIPNQNGDFKKIDEIFGNNDKKKFLILYILYIKQFLIKI